jgi:hypothetical protein
LCPVTSFRHVPNGTIRRHLGRVLLLLFWVTGLVPLLRYPRTCSCQQLKQVMVLMCSSLRLLLSFFFAAVVVAATSSDVRMGTLPLAAGENSRQTFLAEQQQHANRMVLGSDFLSNPFPRHLQEGGNYSLDPEDICAAYQRGGLFSCTCERYDKYDVIIDCNFHDLQCDSMNITCIAMNFTMVLASPGINQRMTTCSDFVNADPPQQTCIEIKPDTPGLYNATVKCGGSYNGQGCQSCAQCTDNENTTITLDCSNVVSGKTSTCQPVSENGATSPLFPAGGEEPTSAAPLRLLDVDSTGFSASLLMSAGLFVLFTLCC